MLYRTAMLGWDNTARRGLKASMFADFSVTRYSQWLSSNIERTAKDPSRTDSERLVFVNAWNEWAEGTHLEPDQKHGYGYLEATRSVVANYPMGSDRFFRPDIPDVTSRRFAVVVHLHYADTWDELKAAILRLSDVDIYVTVTSSALAQVVCADMPSAVIEIMDNRGRDVRPFLHMMKRISHLKYRAVCKVHGKKSVYRMDGDNLRSKLISTLLDPSVIEKFDSNDRLGMVATASSLIPHNENNMHTNSEQVHAICEEIAVPFVSGRFVAGTMFWVDPRAIEPLFKLRTNDFDVERGLVDGTRAHAIERLFCVVCEARGFEIAEV
jgi:lipopolysaccharide biosynthesis protein